MLIQGHLNKGFTIIEIMLSLAFLAIAAGMAMPVMYSFQARNDLDVSESVITQMLRSASQLSKSGSRDSAWGVRVATSSVTLFQGASYGSRVAAQDTVYRLPDSVTSSSQQEIVYAKLAGIPAQTSSITLVGLGREGRSIAINSMGTITSSAVSPEIPGPPGVPELNLLSGSSIPDGGTQIVGSVPAGVQQSIAYSIANTGSAAASLTGTPRVLAVAGTNIASVSVTVQPAISISSGGSSGFTIAYTPALPGAFSFTVQFANNDSDENPYNWTVSGTAIAGSGSPEMDVDDVSIAVADGSIYFVGIVPVGGATSLDFQIVNTGTGTLFMSDTTRVVLTPIVNAANLSVDVPPPASIPAGGSAIFTVSFEPLATGNTRFSISIGNTDSNENPYDWTVRGRAQ